MKIYLDTIGCRLNQAEIESMARQFRVAGHEIVASPDQAELAVVNTCAVTNDAVSVSRSKIRQIARLGVNEIVATGCWATLQPKEASALPNVLHVVTNAEKENLVAQTLDLPPSTFDLEPIERQPLPGLHRRTRAFIKVQDGCDNHCTFCITTSLHVLYYNGRAWGRAQPPHSRCASRYSICHPRRDKGNCPHWRSSRLMGI
jgi:threonylcarbamoyladenosine tRNA methylthiotransferase MtaB